MLSCDCSGDYDYYVEQLGDFSPLGTVRSRRCSSCNKKIKVGETALCFSSHRSPRCEYEENRFGDEVPLANLFFCESCGEIWLNLNATGLCVTFGDMREALQEYWQMTGFSPDKYTVNAQQSEGV